jgi:hypothetical protein
MRILVSALAVSASCVVATPVHSQVNPTPPQPTAPAASAAEAQPALFPAGRSGDFWRVIYSPATYHYSYDAAHRYVWMIGAERQRTDGIVWGATYFSNSFGQPSAYVFGGERMANWSAYPQLFAEWNAGLLYGYKGQYADKVPLNRRGFSPGLVLAVGWQFTPAYSAQLNVLGNSALMLQVSVDLP